MVPKNALSQQARAIALSSGRIFSAVHPLVSSLLRSVLMVPKAPEMSNCSPVLSTLTLLGMLIRDCSSTCRVKALALLCICLLLQLHTSFQESDDRCLTELKRDSEAGGLRSSKFERQSELWVSIPKR